MRRRSLTALAILATALTAGCGGDGSGSGDPDSGASFEPRASLRAIGGTARTAKPAFALRIEARPGDANIRSATLTFPASVIVDQAAIGRICSERELRESSCAGRHRMGVARVLSPAYDGALRGPVYPVSGSGGLPKLAYLLSGPAEVLLRGRISAVGARLQAGVDDVPDTPLSAFELRIDGGRSGFLIVSRDLCGAEPTADVSFTSQDGETAERRVPVEADCPG